MMTRLAIIATACMVASYALGVTMGIAIADARQPAAEYITDPAVCRMALREFAYFPPDE